MSRVVAERVYGDRLEMRSRAQETLACDLRIHVAGLDVVGTEWLWL